MEWPEGDPPTGGTSTILPPEYVLKIPYEEGLKEKVVTYMNDKLYYLLPTYEKLFFTLRDNAGNETTCTVQTEATINPLSDTSMLYYQRSNVIAKVPGRTYYKNANTDDPMLGGYMYLTDGSTKWANGFGIANTKRACATRCDWGQCKRS